MATKTKGLGRGLSALIPTYQQEENTDTSTGGITFIAIDKIKTNENQPRKSFPKEKIEELADSIRQHGVIQPILVVKNDEIYTIVAGERRFRASIKAGLKEVPVIIKDFTEQDISEIALIENLQREDLNAIEEATAYEELKNKYSLTQEEIANRLGKSRTYIANTLRLLSLDEKVQKLIEDGYITPGHARCVLRVTEDKQKAFAEKIVKENLSVREAEDLSKNFVVTDEKNTVKQHKPLKEKPAYLIDIEEELQLALGAKVRIDVKGKKGKIEIDYAGNEDLERLVTLLKTIREE